MQNLSIEYSIQDFSLRVKTPKVAWISETGIIEWSTKDFPESFPVGKMLDWVLYQNISDHLDHIILELGPKLERLKYFKTPFKKLKPSLPAEQIGELRALIEYRLPDEFNDFSIELQDLNLGLHLTELSKFYLYFAHHLPQMNFTDSSEESVTVLLSKDQTLIREWNLPFTLDIQAIKWLSSDNDLQKEWIIKLKECFQCEDDKQWSFFQTGFDLFIISNKHWTIWIQGELTTWELCLICLHLLCEIYPPSSNFDQIKSLIISRCCPWPQSKVQVNLS